MDGSDFVSRDHGFRFGANVDENFVAAHMRDDTFDDLAAAQRTIAGAAIREEIKHLLVGASLGRPS